MELKLTNWPEPAIIDDDNVDLVKGWTWHLNQYGDKCCVQGTRNTPGSRKSQSIVLGRLVMGFPPGKIVDHKDRNPLNNLRSNLRVCDSQQSACNRGKRAGAKSKYKGVYKKGNKFEVQIRVCGVLHRGGSFIDEIEAAKKYDTLAIRYFGEFACLNFGD